MKNNRKVLGSLDSILAKEVKPLISSNIRDLNKGKIASKVVRVNGKRVLVSAEVIEDVQPNAVVSSDFSPAIFPRTEHSSIGIDGFILEDNIKLQIKGSIDEDLIEGFNNEYEGLLEAGIPVDDPDLFPENGFSGVGSCFEITQKEDGLIAEIRDPACYTGDGDILDAAAPFYDLINFVNYTTQNTASIMDATFKVYTNYADLAGYIKIKNNKIRIEELDI